MVLNVFQAFDTTDSNVISASRNPIGGSAVLSIFFRNVKEVKWRGKLINLTIREDK